jgi:hypothetical protein
MRIGSINSYTPALDAVKKTVPGNAIKKTLPDFDATAYSGFDAALSHPAYHNNA